MTWSATAPAIKAVILDIDGVLTDGRLAFLGSGEVLKYFDVRDGHAMKMAMRAGLKVGLLSGRQDPINTLRAKDLDLSFCYQGAKDKGVVFDQLLREQQLTAEACLYMGDDVVDLPVLRRVALAVCPADAAPELPPYCTLQTRAPGGRGAVREMLFALLAAQGKLDGLMARYIAS